MFQLNNKTLKNVLLLGASGSGKSTLINAFESFGRHQSFDDAYDSETKSKIPTKIVFSDNNYQEINIKCGNESSNECMEPNKSSTGKCKTYAIPVNDDFEIQFIDTPGFASTCGPKYDEKSATHIVDYLSQYEELHAIAIVIRGNDSTTTTNFNYWVQQILTMLPKSVCDNVMFVFSNVNKPKGSLAALKTELKRLKEEHKVMNSLEPCKENVFSFENEGLITIAARQQKFTINTRELKTSQSNWDASKVESKYLIEWLKKAAPFKSEEITQLNDVRQFLLQVYNINEQFKGKITYENVKSEVMERNMKEGILLDKATRKACDFIINKAMLCSNFKKQDYLKEIGANESNEDVTSLFMNILNSPNEIISEISWTQIQHLKSKLVLKSIHSPQFSFLFQSQLRQINKS